jgi:NADH:ubiquinone oxidoreductase subunit K
VIIVNYLAAVALLVIGLYAVLTRRNMIKIGRASCRERVLACV